MNRELVELVSKAPNLAHALAQAHTHFGEWCLETFARAQGYPTSRAYVSALRAGKKKAAKAEKAHAKAKALPFSKANNLGRWSSFAKGINEGLSRYAAY